MTCMFDVIDHDVASHTTFSTFTLHLNTYLLLHDFALRINLRVWLSWCPSECQLLTHVSMNDESVR